MPNPHWHHEPDPSPQIKTACEDHIFDAGKKVILTQYLVTATATDLQALGDEVLGSANHGRIVDASVYSESCLKLEVSGETVVHLWSDGDLTAKNGFVHLPTLNAALTNRGIVFYEA